MLHFIHFFFTADNLFAFGDVEGKARDARLQHPLDVILHGALVLIADTYNHGLKLFDLGTKLCRRLDIGPCRLNEPNGLAVSSRHLWLADTNAHSIKRASMSDLQSPLRFDEFVVRFGEDITDGLKKSIVHVRFNLPLNVKAANKWELRVVDSAGQKSTYNGTLLRQDDGDVYKMSLTSSKSRIAQIEFDLSVVCCVHNEKLGEVCQMFRKTINLSRAEIDTFNETGRVLIEIKF